MLFVIERIVQRSQRWLNNSVLMVRFFGAEDMPQLLIYALFGHVRRVGGVLGHAHLGGGGGGMVLAVS